MPLSGNQTEALARYLDQALCDAREVDRLTTTQPDLSLPDSYRVQDAGIRFRLTRGERQIGLKMGLTSEAKRKQMNLSSPIYGVLTDRMQVEEGSTFSLQGKIHPKIEPEVAFLVAKDLRGRPNAQEALAACSGICAAMEILDSRYTGFKYFSLPDVVADNSSSAYFVLGRNWVSPRDCDGSDLEMVMEVNGKPVQSALSSAISGNPIHSLVLLCGLLEERGLYLPAGSIVLAGAATEAVKLEPGMEVRLKVQTLGDVRIRI